MLVLFTDFGLQGPYVGLMKLALLQGAPACPVIDLFHDAPAFDVQAAAYLLAGYVDEFPAKSVFVGVVDPGVGSERPGIVVRADDRWFVGPDNGLFDRIVARASQSQAWHIIWQPERLSASFHGRDIFAPIAAKLVAKTVDPTQIGRQVSYSLRDWPDDLARIVYIDRYGNAMTGIRADSLAPRACLKVGERQLLRARTFSDVPPGQGFWYRNSSGLVELAVNQGSAAEHLRLRCGDEFRVTTGDLTRIACT